MVICANCRGAFVPLKSGDYECTQCGGHVKLDEDGNGTQGEKMDEIYALHLADQAMTSEVEVIMNMRIRELCLIVTSLQLTVAHPGLHEPLKTVHEQLGRQLQAAIAGVMPEVDQLLELGWHRENDVDSEQDDPAAPHGWYDDFDETPQSDEGIPW